MPPSLFCAKSTILSTNPSSFGTKTTIVSAQNRAPVRTFTTFERVIRATRLDRRSVVSHPDQHCVLPHSGGLERCCDVFCLFVNDAYHCVECLLQGPAGVAGVELLKPARRLERRMCVVQRVIHMKNGVTLSCASISRTASAGKL